MKREIFLTKDGSSSIQIPSQNVTYHSRHGAITESNHVYIDAGFSYWHQRWPKEQTCHIFEMGFGTGLNALLTLQQAEKLQRKVVYTAIELYPLEKEIIDQLNYSYPALHACEWEKQIQLTPFFSIEKIYEMLLPGGKLVTYCSKGEVQRAMKAAGLMVEKVPGPPGKREMIRAHH